MVLEGRCPKLLPMLGSVQSAGLPAIVWLSTILSVIDPPSIKSTSKLPRLANDSVDLCIILSMCRFITRAFGLTELKLREQR